MPSTSNSVNDIWILCPTCVGSGSLASAACQRCQGACFVEYIALKDSCLSSFNTSEGLVVKVRQIKRNGKWVSVSMDSEQLKDSVEESHVRDIFVFAETLANHNPLITMN